MALSSKQKAFITEYLKCWNATEAARKAKYKGNDVTLASVGYENLRKPQIAEAIQEYFAREAMAAEEVLFHLAQIARGDLADLLDKDGRPSIEAAKMLGKSNLIKKLTTRTVISTTDDDGETTEVIQDKVEIYDRMRALELIGKHLGLFTEKVDITSGGEPIIIKTGMDVDEL